MGRPTESESRALHERILRSARRVFLDDGFKGASLEHICELAGVTKRTLYRRYPDKLTLLRETMRWPEMYGTMPVAAPNPRLSLEKNLVKAGDALLEWILGEDTLRTSRLTIEVRDLLGEELQRRNEDHATSVLEGFQQILASWRSDLEARDLEFHTHAFLRLVVHSTYVEALEGRRAPGYTNADRALTRRHVALFLNGFNAAG